MQAKAVINGYDIARWAKEEGIQQKPISRCGRSIVTLDGTLRKTEIVKRGVTIALVEIRDSTLREITAALSSPAEFFYTDREKGDRTAQFYVTVPDSVVKTVRGGNTYWNGITIELEEV